MWCSFLSWKFVLLATLWSSFARPFRLCPQLSPSQSCRTSPLPPTPDAVKTLFKLLQGDWSPSTTQVKETNRSECPKPHRGYWIFLFCLRRKPARSNPLIQAVDEVVQVAVSFPAKDWNPNIVLCICPVFFNISVKGFLYLIIPIRSPSASSSRLNWPYSRLKKREVRKNVLETKTMQCNERTNTMAETKRRVDHMSKTKDLHKHKLQIQKRNSRTWFLFHLRGCHIHCKYE